MKVLTRDDLRIVGKVGYKPKNNDRVEYTSASFPSGKKYDYILQQAEHCFNSFYDIRRRARRNFKFYRGEQWSDIIEVNGVKMTEEEYILKQGKPALKQNLIRPPLRNIIGQYRNSPFKSVISSANKEDQTAAEMMTIAFESAYRMNDGKARDARMLESFLLTGAVIAETAYTLDNERMRPLPSFRAVNLERFFCDVNMEDVLGKDVMIVGEIVDTPLIDLVSTYAKNTKQEDELRRIYAGTREDYNDRGKAFDEKYLSNLSFLIPATSNLCRVIKVCILEGEWKILAHDYADATYEAYPLSYKSKIDAENNARMEMARENDVDVPLIEYETKFLKTWHYYHLTPHGQCLWHAECPYSHNSHPYVFKFYPMLNGSVWSMVEDIIDQQKMINRAIIQQDFMNSAGAKGVLLVPEECISDDFPIETIADEWVRYNGVIKIKSKPGIDLPKQIVSNTLNPGNMELLRMEMDLMRDIHGVQGAIQGQQPTAGTPAARFAQETMNSSINTLDYLETFSEFVQKRDFKIVQLIKQFYKERHYQDLGGRNTTKEAKYYDPDTIRNVDFENTISKGNDTPTYRMVIDDMLWNMLKERLISLEMFLEHSSYPFSDKLLASIKTMKEQIEQGNASGADINNMNGQLNGMVQQIQGAQQNGMQQIQKQTT